MGHVGNEFALVFLRMIQLMGHVVQGVRQLPHLVLAVEDQFVFQIALCILHGCGIDPIQWFEDNETNQ